jgi:hypothetical protein
MTVERKIVVSTQDIKAISYECKACGAKVSFPPDKALDAMNQCFSCKTEWKKETPTVTREDGNALKLAEAVAGLRMSEQRYGFRVLFEFDEARNSN